MLREHGIYQIDDERQRVDFPTVRGWLATTYWSPGTTQADVERGAKYSSLVVGAYLAGKQVGYLRVVSDRYRFAYIADVIVDPAHRGRGIGRAMVKFSLEHPDHRGLHTWVLATHDAHGVYRSLGFEPLTEPDRWMQYRPALSDKVRG